jgi:hypothetical protein
MRRRFARVLIKAVAGIDALRHGGSRSRETPADDKGIRCVSESVHPTVIVMLGVHDQIEESRDEQMDCCTVDPR